MVQANVKEMKKSVKGNILLISIIWMVIIVVNIAIGLVLQAKQAEKTVEGMLTDNLNGSYALVQKGIGYFGSVEEALTPEALNTIIANNSCDTIILDPSGKAVVSYFRNGFALSSYSQYVQKSGQTLYTNATGTKGSRMVYAAKAIESTGYTLLIGAPSGEYYSGLITSFWVNSALVIIVAVMLVITNIFISKVIVAPLNKIRNKVMEMSRGNLSGAKVDINTNDDLGVLASSVNYLADCTNDIINDIHRTADEIAHENLCVKPKAQYNGDFLPVKIALEEIVRSMKDVVANIEEAGREVSASSSQMSSNSSMLSMAADESTAIVQQMSSDLNDVHNQINDSAEKAGKAREMTNVTIAAVDQGNEKMSDMLDAMKEINATSAQIANIIKTIQDISFQTNILSLNASIEAARAGAAGKGFAVVAGEVGSLAGKTAEAAKSTTKLIETSLKAVEHGTVIANETADMLNSIMGKANESAEVVEQIAHAATKQAESIKQSIEDMDKITVSITQVSSAAHDCQSSSQALASQSAMLEDTVNKFVLDEKDTRAMTAATAPRPAVSAPKPAAVPKPVSKPVPSPAPKAKTKIELPNDPKPAASESKPAASASKSEASAPKSEAPASKPAAPASKPAAPASKPAAPASKPAAPASKSAAPTPKPAAAPKPKAKISLPDDEKPAAPAPKPVQAANKPKAKIELPDDKKPAAPAPAPRPAPAAKAKIELPDDNAPAGQVVKKATMQPVKRTVRMDPNKY